MSFIDDLNKAVGMFDQQVQTYKTTQAFAKATEQISQANTSLTKEMDKRVAIQGAAQNLAQELLAAGAPVERIQAAFSAFSPQAAPSSAERIGVGIQTGDQELVQQGIKQDKAMGQAQQDFKKELLGMQKTGPQSDLPERKFKVQNFGEFQKSNKLEFEALGKAENSLSILRSSNDPAVIGLSLFGLLKIAGNTGAVSDKELELAVPGGASLFRKAQREMKTQFMQEATQYDKQFVEKLMTAVGQKVQAKALEKAKAFAKQRSKLVGVSEEDLFNDLKLGIPSFNGMTVDNTNIDQVGQPKSAGLDFRKYKK